jgi:hypothetical protein
MNLNTSCSKTALLEGLEIDQYIWGNRIGGVMVRMLELSVVDRGFESRSGETKEYTNWYLLLSVKHTALRRKNKDWLAWNQDNVSEWDDYSYYYSFMHTITHI